MYRLGILAFGPAPWSKRKAVFEVAQFAVRYGQVGIITQDRDNDSAPAPVDVEPGGVRRLWAKPQHIPPGWILDRMLNAEMVRHDVDDHPQSSGPGTGQQPFQRLRTAPVLVHTGDIGCVVTMIRADCRLQDR